MTASGRRIKRRGSGRSSGDEATPALQQQQQGGAPSAIKTEASVHSGTSVSDTPFSPGAVENARINQLLEAQKRAYEVRSWPHQATNDRLLLAR